MDDFRAPLRFEPTVAGHRLVLPRRRPRKGSVFTFLFGLAFAGVPGYFLGYGAWQAFVTSTDDGAARWSHLLPMLFATPFVVIGSVLVLTPLTLWLTRTTITLEGDDLIVKDGVGPFGLKRRRHADTLAGFEVDVGATRVNRGPTRPMKHFATLTAPCKDARRPMVIAVGYPRDTANELAQLLAERLNTSGRLGPERTLPIIETVGSFRDEPDIDEHTYDPREPVPELPAGSRIAVGTSARGVRYDLPALGAKRAGRGLFAFGLLWTGFMAAVVIGELGFGDGSFQTESGDRIPTPVAVGIISVLGLVGVGMIVAALRAGHRRATIHVRTTSPGSMRIETHGLFRSQTYDLPTGGATAVRAVRTMDMGSKEERNRHHDLRIDLDPSAADALGLPAYRNPLRLFPERGKDELRWLAVRLRHDLQVPRYAPLTLDESEREAARA